MTTPLPELPRYLTVAQVAAELQVPRDGLKLGPRWHDHGLAPAPEAPRHSRGRERIRQAFDGGNLKCTAPRSGGKVQW